METVAVAVWRSSSRGLEEVAGLPIEELLDVGCPGEALHLESGHQLGNEELREVVREELMEPILRGQGTVL